MIKADWKELFLVFAWIGGALLALFVTSVVYPTKSNSSTVMESILQKSQDKRPANGIAHKLLNGGVADFYSNSKVTVQQVANSTKVQTIEKQAVEWEETLSFTNRKTANAMETNRPGEQYQVIKVYQLLTGGQAEVYKVFSTKIADPHISIMDEAESNSFKLNGWYTQGEQADISNGFTAIQWDNGVESGGYDIGVQESTAIESVEATETSGAQNGVADNNIELPVIRAGHSTGNIRLKEEEKALVLVYTFKPIISQLNVVKMVYQADGLHIDTARIPFPIDNTLQLETLVPNGILLEARGTADNTFKLVSNWQDTASFQNETVINNAVQLDTGVNTVYLHILDKMLINNREEQTNE